MNRKRHANKVIAPLGTLGVAAVVQTVAQGNKPFWFAWIFDYRHPEPFETAQAGVDWLEANAPQLLAEALFAAAGDNGFEMTVHMGGPPPAPGPRPRGPRPTFQTLVREMTRRV